MHITPEKIMIAFEIQDMTCGHCREAITRAVLGVDSAAVVETEARPVTGGRCCSGSGAICST